MGQRSAIPARRLASVGAGARRAKCPGRPLIAATLSELPRKQPTIRGLERWKSDARSMRE